MTTNKKRAVHVLLMAAFACSATAMDSIEPGDSSYPQLEVRDYGYNFLEKNDIKADIPTLTTSLLGDKIDYFSGSISFEQVDVSIPGNFDIPVNITRTLGDPDGWHRGTREFGNWSLSIPHISSTYITDKSGNYKTAYWPNGKACRSQLNSNPKFSAQSGSFGTILWSYSADGDNYWSGDSLSIPGHGSVKFTEKVGDSTHKRYNKNNWPVSCYDTPAGHEGFIVTTDNGNTYTFSQRKDVESIKPFNLVPASSTVPCEDGSSLNPCSPETLSIPGDAPESAQHKMFRTFMLISKVEDIHGNWVKYEYHTNGNLKRIHSSDNREITLTYNPEGYVEQITANDKVWNYNYDFYSLPTLERVTLPDNTHWDFEYDKHSSGGNGMWHRTYHLLSAQAPVGGIGCIETGAQEYISIKHPQGAKGTFTLQRICHGTSNVPKIHKFNSQLRTYETYWIEPEKQLHSIVTKSLDLNGDEPYVWNYQYSRKKGVFRGDTPGSDSKFTSDISGLNTADYNRTTVIYPDNSTKMMYFDRRHGYSYGNMTHEVSYSPTGTKMQLVTHSYEDGNDYGSTLEYLEVDYTEDNFAGIDLYEGWSATKQQRKTSVVTQLYDGGSSTDYASYFSDFNQYDRHRITKQQGPSGTRYFKVDFLHDTAKGLLNLPIKHYVSSSQSFGSPFKETVYKSGTNLPYLEKVFGQTLRTNEYNTDGTLKKISYDGSNRYESFSNYYRGKPTTVTLPCAATNGCGTANGSNANTIIAKLEVNPDGTTKSVTDFKGNKTSYTYNTVGWLTGVNFADSSWADKSIDYHVVTAANDGLLGSSIPIGSLRQTISQGNLRSISYYDLLLRKIFTVEKDVTISGTTRYQHFEYDHDNRQTLASMPSTAVLDRTDIKSEYDALGRLAKQIRTDNNSVSSITQKVYLSENRIQEIDALGNVITTKFRAFSSPGYDMAIHIDAPDSDAISIGYNLYNQITNIEQGGITESRYYDTLQRLCKSYRPELGASVFGYNTQRQLAWRAEGASVSSSGCSTSGLSSSQQVHYGYNNLGTLSLENFPDSTGDKTYGYDENGNLTSLGNGFSNWSYGYNSLNLLRTETLSVDGKSYGVVWDYDALGQQSSVTYPSGRIVDLQPNALGQPTRAGNYATNAKYHPSGALTSFTYGNGVNYSQSYDSFGRPELLEHSGSQDVVSLTYDYDNADNLIGLTDGIESSNSLYSFDYDGSHRLTQVRGSWGLANFSYDGQGNLLTKALGNQSLTLTYDTDKNRLASISGSKAQSFSYDNRGNTTNNGRFSLTYNLGNMVTSANGNQYTYDGQGKRIKTVSAAGKTTYSLYSQGGKLLHKADPASATKKSTDYVYLGNKLIAKVDNAPDIPATPSSIITPSTDTNGSFLVSWSSVTGASKYTLSEQVNSGTWKQIDGNLTSTSKTISGKNTATYRYRVNACNVSGCGSYKYSSNTTVVRTPGSISYPSSTANGSATISWSYVSGATSYQLQRLSSSKWSTVYSGSSTSKALSGMSAGSYRFRVRACKDSICGNYKESYSVLKVISPNVNLRWLQSSVPTVASDAQVSWTADGADYCTSNDFERGKTLAASGTAWATAFSYPTSTVSITCYWGSISKTDSASIQVDSNSIGGGGFGF
ncbi:RHS repeat domain-containing protein [Ferrimonas futtsuensis]|uniref:RHS repeat domain-containing protein n=1 Tax=Ferrimonas futtsuensis TaxID=364764 RepID=UPI00040B07CC|nr:hypothetical protein [Ferrimonas futtsuensis]